MRLEGEHSVRLLHLECGCSSIQIRCEQCRDPRLIEATRRNLDLMRVNKPFVRALLLVLSPTRLDCASPPAVGQDSLLKLVHKWHRRRNP